MVAERDWAIAAYRDVHLQEVYIAEEDFPCNTCCLTISACNMTHAFEPMEHMHLSVSSSLCKTPYQ